MRRNESGVEIRIKKAVNSSEAKGSEVRREGKGSEVK
jgi:hypothetical protein